MHRDNAALAYFYDVIYDSIPDHYFTGCSGIPAGSKGRAQLRRLHVPSRYDGRERPGNISGYFHPGKLPVQCAYRCLQILFHFVLPAEGILDLNHTHNRACVLPHEA